MVVVTMEPRSRRLKRFWEAGRRTDTFWQFDKKYVRELLKEKFSKLQENFAQFLKLGFEAFKKYLIFCAACTVKV